MKSEILIKEVIKTESKLERYSKEGLLRLIEKNEKKETIDGKNLIEYIIAKIYIQGKYNIYTEGYNENKYEFK